MKFLLDQDVYAATARFLSGLGHDVVRVSQIGLSQADDEELLQVAKLQERLLVTRDRDFGSLVFVKSLGPAFSTCASCLPPKRLFTTNSKEC